MPAQPVAELLQPPKEYGTSEVLLKWGAGSGSTGGRDALLAGDRETRRRPHVVPLDGIWLDDCWFFGGSAETVKHRNLKANPRAVLYLEDAGRAVIVEGVCEELFPDGQLAERLAACSTSKYGYGPDPASYTTSGVWRLPPQRVLSWSGSPATRPASCPEPAANPSRRQWATGGAAAIRPAAGFERELRSSLTARTFGAGLGRGWPAVPRGN